jgi:iron(III) transport system substrate-binding protein
MPVPWGRRRMRWLVVLLLAAVAPALGFGCGHQRSEVVVYAAQDRVFAEPVLREFERLTGFRARALYDSEATKTVGLANRLLAESGRPQADLWWSNEEMRTRQLVERQVLEPGFQTMGGRRRVLVVRTNSELARAGEGSVSLAILTNAVWRGRVAMAYPVFGSTTTHFLVLREQWGEAAWKTWCQAMAANRPWVVDGNSVVVRLVGRGDADVGITDSDDVAFGRREGLPVMELPLPNADSLWLPNTVAFVSGSRNRAGANAVAEFLKSPWVLQRLREEGAIDSEAGHAAKVQGLTEERWSVLLAGMDASLEWLRETFVR